jgi:hypothetical protein
MVIGGWLVKLKDFKEINYTGEGYSVTLDSSWLKVVYVWPEKSRIEKRRFLFFNYNAKIIESEKVEQTFLMAPREKVEYVKVFAEEKDNGSGKTESSKSKDNTEEVKVSKTA